VPRCAVHAQRRGGNLETARRECVQRRLAPAVPAAVAADVAFRADHACAVRSGARRVGGGSPDLRTPVCPESSRARPRRTNRRRYDVLRAVERAAVARASRVHRFDGLAAERRRDDVLLPRDPAAHPGRGTRCDGQHHRPRANTGRTPPRRAVPRRRGHWTGRRCPAARAPRRRIRRAPPDRRRHAPQDFRGHGDGQGRRVDHDRRRRPSGQARRRHRRRGRPRRIRERGGPSPSAVCRNARRI